MLKYNIDIISTICDNALNFTTTKFARDISNCVFSGLYVQNK